MLTDRISNCIQELFGFFPSKTWVSNGLSVAVFADLVVSWLDVAFDHQTLYQMTDIIRMTAAVENFFCDTYLFCILLVGVGMVGIYDAGRVL